MHSFPYTQKKFNSMPLARQHKWVAFWIKEQYLSFLTQPVTRQQLLFFLQNYQRILLWMQLTDNKIELTKIESNPIEYLANLYHRHQTLTGLGIREYDLLPQIRQGDRVTDEPWIAKIEYKVALDNFRSAFNVGSIFRTCDAVGFEEVVLGGYSPSKLNPRVKKTAMGSTEWIPENVSSNLPDTLHKHNLAGYEIIGLETVIDTVTIDRFRWPEKGVIVMGNEEHGISQAVMKSCTKFVSIPMYGRKNSLNVANAFSIVAYSVCSALIEGSKEQ